MCRSVAVVVAAASLSVAFTNMAAAADLPAQPAPYRAPVAVPVPAFSWTGFYIGGHGGGGSATHNATTIDPTAEFPGVFVLAGNKPSGFLAGGYVGFNYQLSQWLVVGLDGDASWSNLSGTSTDPSIAGLGAVANTTTKIDWFATGTGRIGFAANNWLFFVKGGGAWASITSNTAVVSAAGAAISTITSTDERWGWVAGAGVEWAFTPNWLVKGEYNYIEFDAHQYNVTSTLAAVQSSRTSTLTMHIGKLGVAYKF